MQPAAVLRAVGPTLAIAFALLGGCASAVQSGHNTALDGGDLVAITNDMAMKIMASRPVQEAIRREKSLSVVVEPVENKMTGEVLPRGPAEAFTARIRALLSRHAPDQFTWVMNRDAFYRLRQRELDVDLGPAPEAVSPRYALVAEFHTLTKETSRQRSAAYLCVFKLTDLDRRTTLWTDGYELKKLAEKGFLD